MWNLDRLERCQEMIENSMSINLDSSSRVDHFF
jgi:hypothetical protein